MMKGIALKKESYYDRNYCQGFGGKIGFEGCPPLKNYKTIFFKRLYTLYLVATNYADENYFKTSNTSTNAIRDELVHSELNISRIMFVWPNTELTGSEYALFYFIYGMNIKGANTLVHGK